MGNKDYYAMLGVNHLASDDEIKRAYKQKALRHHPDKNCGDVEAEKKFMDISEAYEILSDPYKRSLYDRFGSEELRNYLGTDPYTQFSSSGPYYTDYRTDSNNDYTYDSYNNYFVRYKDPSTFYDLYVTLEEVNKGATRKMKITRKRFNAELNTTVRDEKLLEIQIKPGWKEGTKITFEGEGDEFDQNTIAGDIVFIIRDKPHPIFERSSSDLIYRVKLTLKQALLGTLIVIPFLDSTKQPYQFFSHHEIITPQTEKRFTNEGLPYPKDPTRHGDLIVKFDILFPKILNAEQRTIVDCCFSNGIDTYHPYESIFHSTIIDETQLQQYQQQQLFSQLQQPKQQSQQQQPKPQPQQQPKQQSQQQSHQQQQQPQQQQLFSQLQQSQQQQSQQQQPQQQQQQQQQQQLFSQLQQSQQQPQQQSQQQPQQQSQQQPQQQPQQQLFSQSQQKRQASPSQKPSIPNLNSTSINKPQSTSTNAKNNQTVLNRHNSSNGHQKSSNISIKNRNKNNKVSSVNASASTSASASASPPTSPRTSSINETVF